MMLAAFVVLLTAHWVGDFVFQTDEMAINKSKSNDALARHVLTYTCVLIIGLIVVVFARFFFTGVMTSGLAMLAFTATNAAAHFATDYFTSRWTSRLYSAGRRHDFFVVIGLDQLIHHATLATTMWLFIFRLGGAA